MERSQACAPGLPCCHPPPPVSPQARAPPRGAVPCILAAPRALMHGACCRRHSGRPGRDLSIELEGAAAVCRSSAQTAQLGAPSRPGGRRHLVPRTVCHLRLLSSPLQWPCLVLPAPRAAPRPRSVTLRACRAWAPGLPPHPTHFRQDWSVCPVPEPSCRPGEVSHLRDGLSAPDPSCGPSHLDLVPT